MGHPSMRRPARHSAKRNASPAAKESAVSVASEGSIPVEDPASQNRAAPGAPHDGDHNQGGVRPEGIDYQRDLGSEQDA